MIIPLRKHASLALILTSLLAGGSSCSAKTPKIDQSMNATSKATSVDDSIFYAKMRIAKAQSMDTLPIGERVVGMGKLFLGTPYVAGTLDQDSVHENLVMNLRGLDCVTFYENMLALARVVKEYPTPKLEDYRKELTLLRYRDGKNEGYHSRLHYSVDYFYNNEKKGVLNVVTREVGGKHAFLDERPINFMTTHRASYKQLVSNDAEYLALKELEENMNARKAFYTIDKKDVADVEKNIQTGDIIGITTNIPGLDCSHTGIAVRMPDNRIHFMHASSLQHKVIVSEEPLAEYLTHSSHQTGIIVNRPLEVRKRNADQQKN